MSDSRPSLLITIDTEGDDLWSPSSEVTTRNARFLPRFQTLCERYGAKPTYLTDWEMVADPAYVDFARDVLRRGAGEIGMHLHAWNSPPRHAPLDDGRHGTYLIDYPEAAMREKITRLTDTLEDTFGVKMLSHRAGRWCFDETYARILEDRGYQVDCSVTPFVSWGRSDFSSFPTDAYFLDLGDIRRPGGSGLLEVPMTIRPTALSAIAGAASNILELLPGGGRVSRYLWPPQRWFKPSGRNVDDMIALAREARVERRAYVEFMLHSSELMPGGSPMFPTKLSIERLYEHMERVLSALRHDFEGMTLSGFRKHVTGDRSATCLPR
ncbi:MAG: deacetylase [Elusimicrobia bacterium]|nr:deacetylase [Elusimicrobiota bacterium]